MEYVDEHVEVPVIKQVHVPTIQKVQRTVKVPQIQWEDQSLGSVCVFWGVAGGAEMYEIALQVRS